MRGQISIEYLSVLIVVLIAFMGITLDLMKKSVDNLLEIQDYAIVKANKVVLDSAVSVLKYSPESTKIVYIRIPPSCNANIDSTSITFFCPSFTQTYSPGANFLAMETPAPGKLIPVQVWVPS